MRGFVALSNWMRKVWSHHFVKEVLFLTTTKWHSGVSCGQGHDPILHSHASDYKARHLCLSVCLSAVHISQEPFIQTTLHSAGLLLRTQGRVLNLEFGEIWKHYLYIFNEQRFVQQWGPGFSTPASWLKPMWTELTCHPFHVISWGSRHKQIGD